MARKAGLTGLNKGLLPGRKGGGASVPALSGANAAAGGYYSPREYGADRGSYEARTAAARAAMEEQQKAFRDAQAALEASRAEAERKRQRYYDLSEQLSGDGAAELLAGIEQDWTDAVAVYGQQRAAYNNARAVYQPYEDAYNRAVTEYNDYIRGEQEAYAGWKATIRPADSIREEQKGIKEKRAELKQLMQLSNQLSARGQMSMLAANERRIEELKAYLGDTDQREKLLEEELQYSEHFRFEDLRENEDFKRGSRVDSSVMNDRYRYINDPAYRNEYQLGLIQSQPGAIVPRNDLYEAGLDMLTAEEKAMYNYCYSTGGAELAEEYLRHKAQELIQRKAGQEFEGVKGQVLPELLFAAPAGVDSFEQGLKGWFGGETPTNVRQTLGGMIREDLAQAGPQMPGWTGGASLGQMAYDAINTTANMAPSILVGTLGQMVGLGGAGTVTLAASAGGNARQEAIREGYTEEQATAYGTMIGAAEGILSSLLGGISALGGKGLARFTGGKFTGFLNNLDNAFLRVGAELGEKMLSEGTEEYVQEIIEPLIRNAAFGEENDLELYTPEALYSGLLGAITGGVMEGPGIIGKAGKGKKANADPQKASTVPKPEGGEYTGFVDDGEETPLVGGDDGPSAQSAGEALGDGTEAVSYEGEGGTVAPDNGTKAPGNGTTDSDNGTPVAGVTAQEGESDAQKVTEAVDENGGKTNEGEHLLHGGPERHDAPGAGEQTEQYEVRRERQRAEARSQAETADQRRIKAQNLERLGKAQRVSSKDLGLKQGTEVKELLELPRYEWDEELWETVSRIEKETGYKVRTVTGNIGVRLKGGGVGLSRGYIDRVSGTIVMNVAHSQVTAGQIADHELWHWKMDAMDRVSGDRYEMTHAAVLRIQEEYDIDDFDAVVDKYIDGYGDVYDMNAPDFLDRIYEEIMADAYAGINAFGADAAKYRGTVDAVMAENGMGRDVWNAQEQEAYAAPGGDQRVYTDEDAPPPREEDYSQVPEYDWGDFDPDDALFSMEDGGSLDAIEKKWAEKTKWLFLHENADTVFLDNMVVKEELRDQGIGTKILEDVIAYADASGKTIALTPTSEFGTKKRLTSWYKKHGFVENKGRNADFRLRDTMYRLPRAADDDVRFSMESAVEETKDLVAVHNLTPQKLLKTLELGGLPMPSIAIARAKEGFNDFGDISLVFHKDTIDPEMYRSNKVYSGDAWTPTYPKVDYKVSAKVQDRVRKKLDGLVPADIRRKLGRAALDTDNLTNALDNHGGDAVEAFKDDDGLKYAFLRELGDSPVLPMVEKKVDEYGGTSNEAIRYFAGKLIHGTQALDHYQNMGAQEMMQQQELLEAVADTYNKEVLWTMEEGSQQYREYEKDPDFKPDNLAFSEVNSLLTNARKYLVNGAKQTVDANAARKLIREKVDQRAFEAWLQELFDGIVEKEGIRNNQDYFTRSGNRRSFEALHYENNLENVIRVMKEKGEKGVAAFGGGNIFGAATREYGSIEEIRSAADERLRTIPESEFEEIKEGFSDRFFELANSLPINKSFSAVDDAANMLTEAVVKYKTKSGMANYLRRECKGWANYSEYVVDDLIQLVSEIRRMPVSYFEAKPQRAVGFDEVAAAVMPAAESMNDPALARIKERLEGLGVPVKEYTYGDSDDRLKKLNEVEDVRFSMESADREYADAVSRGDMQTAQKMVDEAAKAAGYSVKGFHATNADFTVFDIDKTSSDNAHGKGIYFTNTRSDMEQNYANHEGPDPWVKVETRAYELAEEKYGLSYEDTLDSDPDIIDQVNECYDEAIAEFQSSLRRVTAYLKFENPLILKKGEYTDSSDYDLSEYDGIIDERVYETFGHSGMDEDTVHYVVFDPRNIKSAEPVTYDDNGEVVPLSKRFDYQSNDIRFSLEDGDIDKERIEAMAARMDKTVMELNTQEVAVHNAKLDAEKREAEAKAERKRRSEQRQMERNRERAQKHKEERQRLRREANAVADTELQKVGKPWWAKNNAAKRIMDLFDTPAGMKNETRTLIEEYLDRVLEKGYIEDEDRRNLMDKLIEKGVVEIEPDEIMSEGRSYLKGNKIYVSDSLRQEFGDDWNSVRKKAFGLGLYLVNDQQQAGVDQWWQDMNGYLPGMFSAEETDQRTMLERLLWIAEEGKAEKLSLAEYTQRLAKQEQVSEAELLDGMAEKLEQELKQFAKDAKVEMRLRDQTHRKVTWYRLQRAADKAHYRETMQNARNRRELNKLQERTLKTLQWLNKNKYRASEEIQAQIQEVLSDIDLYAVGAANELNWHPKYEMTWRDLAEVYKAAKAKSEDTEDPFNFFTDKELERIVDRLEKRKLEELDVNALNDLFNAAVAIRKAIFDADKALSFATDQEFDKIYQAMTTEMHLAKKPKKGSVQDKFFNIEQLTPMNVLRQMGGWRPDGTFAKMAGVLEQGEKDVRAYKVKANRILADWLEAHRDWVHKADGQGKDGIWIEVDVPRLEGIGLDGGATFGETVKVKMTPMQRVHLYLESRNEDNLRHMVGGRTFADPELYSQGKRTEAYAQGITVKMAPETVKALVANMTQEELELARLLDSYYNGLAHDEINRVSNKLYGYNKAMGKRYAPIFTNQNFTKSEAGIFDQTAEGVGNLKERVKAKNPSYNISALDAFERNVDKTAEFVGMAIPVRDWNSLMNWRTRDSSMKDQITHEWGQGRLEYIDKLLVDLQGGAPTESDVMQELGDKLLSNYISSIFGFNPSIVLKQAGSLPLAAAYLGAENMSFDMLRKERRSREFIAKYTQELQWRSMGYDMPETKQLKDKPGWAQKSGKKWVEDVFGGGYITKMDEATASVLWAWAENKVRAEHPGLEVGDQKTIDEGRSPFYQKVAEEFDRAVSHSQSVSDVAHQSTMRRSKGVLARTFTMFRSDSAQTYNALRQMWGEKEYWQTQMKAYEKASSERDKELLRQAQEHQEKAAKRIGTVVVAMASNALLAELVDFAMAALKGKLDRYEDEEEERMTALSVLGEMFGGILESGAGVVVFGDEAAALLGRLITGEKGYGEEAPGLEQLLDLVDRFETAVAGVKKGDILGAVREVGMAFSTYYAGFPAENMEKFLISGLGKHLAPGLVAGYEDLLEAPTKSDLKGMKGAALEARLGHVMKEYGMDLDGEARAALAKIYEAGYTDAVPSAAPAKVTIDGRERKFGKQAQRQYDKIRSQVVNGELAAVLASPFFKEADEKTQAKMLKRLYDFAGEKAKEEVLEDYESDSTALAEYTEIAQAGGSIADCVIFQTETADMKSYMKADLLREWDAGDEAKRLMFHHLISGSYEEELEKLGKVGLGVDQFLELYAMHGQIDGRDDISATDKATEFAYWLDGQRYTQAQKAAVRSELAFFQFMPAEAARYNTAAEAGLDRDDALELTGKLNELEPPEGKTSIQQIQKWRVGIDNAWGPENQLQQLKAVGMDDAAYAKCEALWDAGVAPAAYVRAQEIKDQFDTDGNGSLTNEDWRNLINSLVPSGIALPGDNERFNMTSEQMGFLWQMLTGSKSTKNNPFSAKGGEKWLDIKNANK